MSGGRPGPGGPRVRPGPSTPRGSPTPGRGIRGPLSARKCFDVQRSPECPSEQKLIFPHPGTHRSHWILLGDVPAGQEGGRGGRTPPSEPPGGTPPLDTVSDLASHRHHWCTPVTPVTNYTGGCTYKEGNGQVRTPGTGPGGAQGGPADTLTGLLTERSVGHAPLPSDSVSGPAV